MAYPAVFILILGTIIASYATVIYPNIDKLYWRVFLNLTAALTSVLYIISWLVNPGYLNKKADGEFMLLLNKFDPNSLCPFCEVV